MLFISYLMYFPVFVGVCGSSAFVFVWLCITVSILYNRFEEEEKAGCFAFIVLEMY